MTEKNCVSKWVCCFAFVLMCSLVSGCRKEKKETAATQVISEDSSGKLCIGFSIDTLAIERWLRDCDVFLSTAKELGADVIVQNSGDSVEEQNKQIMYLISRKVNVLVIVAKKADSLSGCIQKARSYGIPVISYDRLITNADINLYMTVNTEKVGEYMAQGLLKVQPAGNWFSILGPKEDYNMTLMQKGIDRVLAGTPVNIVFTYYTDGWNYDLSYKEMSEKLKDGDIPDAVICGNDAVADSVIRAISENYHGKHIPICGQDADIAACQNIVEGKQTLTVYKPVTRLAQMAAEYAVKLAAGKTVAELLPKCDRINNGYGNIPVIWLDPHPVAKENIDDVVIKSDFHTYGEVYRNTLKKQK